MKKFVFLMLALTTLIGRLSYAQTCYEYNYYLYTGGPVVYYRDANLACRVAAIDLGINASQSASHQPSAAITGAYPGSYLRTLTRPNGLDVVTGHCFVDYKTDFINLIGGNDTNNDWRTVEFIGYYRTAQCDVFPDELELPAINFCSAAGSAVGNPIVPATGEKVLTQSDYTGAGPNALSLVRSYRSSRVVGANTGPATAGMGQPWSHNHSTYLALPGTAGSSGSTAKIMLADGTVRAFTFNTASGNYEPSNSADALSVNAAGLLYKRLDDDSSWQFNAAGKLQTATQRSGWITTYSYSTASTPVAIAPAAGLLISVANQFGRSISFAYNASSQLTSATTPDGQVTSYGYDGTAAAARLTAITHPGAATKTYLYENAAFPQLLTGITDEAGSRYETLAYDTQGRGISTELAGGANKYTISYPATSGASTAPTVVTDPLGTARNYNYSTTKGKLAVTGANLPSGSGGSDAASRVQDANGFVTQETDFLGVQTMYTWDITRRLPLSTTEAAGRPEAQTSSTQWHPSYRLAVLMTEAGRSTAYTYDTQGNKLSEVITDTTAAAAATTNQARTRAWTYNPSSLVVTSTDPKGGITTYAYNAQGQASSMTNPLGHVSTYAYDAAGRLASQTEPNGLASSYAYDARGRLLASTTGSGASLEVTTYTYHPTGQLATAVLPSGYSAAYTYDAAQRLIAAVDNRGIRIDYTLDAMGNRLREEVKDPGGNIALLTRRVVNQLNRIASLQGANNQNTAIDFDLNGEATSQTDPLGQTTAQTLDSLRRPVATRFADNTQSAQAFNSLDQLTSVTDPKGVATQYQRNAFGDVLSEASPDTGTISYQRNAAGEVIASLDANGNAATITRDALGRPLVVTRSNPNSTTSQIAHVSTYTYDTGSAGAQTGYLASLQDPSGRTTYERDSFGRILSKTQQVNDNPAAPGTYTTRYTYSTGPNKGELASITYPSGLKAIYSRSASGQITGISTQAPGFNKPTVPFVSAISYTALGQPKAWNWANGASAVRTFDADGRMTSNELASYTFDAAMPHQQPPD